jgi:hypothetical protein
MLKALAGAPVRYGTASKVRSLVERIRGRGQKWLDDFVPGFERDPAVMAHAREVKRLKAEERALSRAPEQRRWPEDCPPYSPEQRREFLRRGIALPEMGQPGAPYDPDDAGFVRAEYADGPFSPLPPEGEEGAAGLKLLRDMSEEMRASAVAMMSEGLEGDVTVGLQELEGEVEW